MQQFKYAKQSKKENSQKKAWNGTKRGISQHVQASVTIQRIFESPRVCFPLGPSTRPGRRPWGRLALCLLSMPSCPRHG